MGISCGKKIDSFDWEKIDGESKTRPPVLRKAKIQRVKNIFLLLENNKKTHELTLDVFTELFYNRPDAINYFRRVTTQSRKDEFKPISRSFTSFKEKGRIKPDIKVKLSQNSFFAGHIKIVACYMHSLVGCLNNMSAFQAKCGYLREFHGKLPGINRVFFQEMLEAFDRSILNILGPLNYEGEERQAVIRFLILVYVLVGKDFTKGPVDWDAIDNRRVQNDTFQVEILPSIARNPKKKKMSRFKSI